MVMKRNFCSWRCAFGASGIITLVGAMLVLVTAGTRHSEAGILQSWCCWKKGNGPVCRQPESGLQWSGEARGTWYWVRSPEEERRVIIGLYNRYCIRCHGVDGRGVWDIPGVPDFTNDRFQASRSDGQLVRAILEGRGACMPPFRGTLTLEEGW